MSTLNEKFKHEKIKDLNQLLPTSPPYILDDSNNFVTVMIEEKSKKVLLPPTDHVMSSISYLADYVSGGNIMVHLFANKPSLLNEMFSIPQCYGTVRFPYKEEIIEISNELANYLIRILYETYSAKK